ncbi:hypothetical protein niasHT_019821 [Heterodera trifolii]|uniref:Uncharacterized protein n=1 Tax=Heterodera trifolii TaxID=157864 RepID=A0ABD2KV25_9BILA
MLLSSNVSHFLLLLLGSLLLLSFISMGNAYKCFVGVSVEADVYKMSGRTKMVYLSKMGTECELAECFKSECTVPGDSLNRLLKKEQQQQEDEEDDESTGKSYAMDFQFPSGRVPMTVWGCAQFCPRGVFTNADIGSECHTTWCCVGDYCNGAAGPNNFGIFATILVAIMTSVAFIRHNVL